MRVLDWSFRVLGSAAAAGLAVGGVAAAAPPAGASTAPYAVSTISSLTDPTGVVVSADGKTSYVFDDQANAIFLVSTASGLITKEVTAASLDRPAAEAINPAGTDIYILNSTGTVSVFSTATSTVTATIGTANGNAGALAISPNGMTAYVSHPSLGIVSVLNLTTNTVARTITVTTPGALALTPDGKDLYVVSGDDPASVEVISTSSYAVTATVTGLNYAYGEIAGLHVSPDGSALYVVEPSANAVEVVATAGNAETKDITGVGDFSYEIASLSGSALGTGGSDLYIAAGDEVTIVATASGTVSAVPISSATIADVALTPDAKTAYVVGTGSGIGQVWNISTGTATVTGTLPTIGSGPYLVGFSPDGKQAYVVNNTDNDISAAGVSVVSTETGEVTAVWPLPADFTSADFGEESDSNLAVSPDGKRIYLPDFGSDKVYVLDAGTGAVLDTITVGDQPDQIALSPDGSTAYVTNAGDSTVSVVDLASSTAVNTINVASRDDGEQDSPDGVVVSPDGKTVYVSTSEGISVINPSTAAVKNIKTGTPCYTSDLALSPNAQTLYDATAFGFLVISAKTDKVVATIPESYDYNSDQIALTPDGTTIFLTSDGSTVQVISTATNSVTSTISNTSFGSLAGLAISPSGKSVYVTDEHNDTLHVLTPVPVAPKITSKGSVTFRAGVTGTFTVTTNGYPAPAITESAPLPKGVTFTSNGNGTATLSGTPAHGTGKAYPLTITASNGAGRPASQSFKLIVDQKPAITSSAETTFTYRKKKSFTVTTTGYPVAAISESGALPPGVKFVNNKNGTATISGTPTLKANKTYAITLRAMNGVKPAATLKFRLILRK